MKKPLTTCLFLFIGSLLMAQTVVPDIKKDFALPVVFASGNQQLLLFYSQKSPVKNTFGFQVAMLDSLDQLQKLYPLQSLNTFQPEEKNLYLLCSYSDQKYHYALFKSGTAIYRISIDRSSQTLQNTLLGTLTKGEELLGGFSFETGPVILTRAKTGQKNFTLHIYRTFADGLKKQPVNGNLPAFMVRKDYRPLLIHAGADMRPDDAIASEKIFADGQKIYFTYEKTPNIYSNDILDLQLTTLNLQNDSIRSELLHFPNKGAKVVGASGASYIFDGKLFQVYFDEKRFGLLVSTLPEHQMLFEKFISGNDGLSLLNSPVFLPLYLMPEYTQKVNKASGLVRSMQAFKPYIYIKRRNGEYLVGLGGYEKQQRYPSVGIASERAGAPFGGVYYYENTASFYALLKGSAQETSADRLDETVLYKLNKANIPENGEFIQVNGRSKYMYLKANAQREGKTFYLVQLPGY